MKEYAFENGREFDPAKLRVDWVPQDKFRDFNAYMVRAFHDVFIEYQGGLLLVVRRNHPADGNLWPIGGTIKKGYPIEDSLRMRARAECGLELDGITELGRDRTMFKTDPWNTGKGTDTINFVYFARGSGELKLDSMHSDPRIVTPGDCTDEFRAGLHPYVRDFMDLAMQLVEKK